MLFNLTRTVDHLSHSLIESTTNRTHKELTDFFDPVKKNLFVSKDWADFGYYNSFDTENLNSRFIPILKNFPQVTAVMVANSHGSEYMLLQEDSSWFNRKVEFVNDRPEIYRSEFVYHDASIETLRIWNENKNYDPRMRPWYISAVANTNKTEPAWTEPYIFFTKQAPGITISTSWICNNDSVDCVLAYDILLMDISKYTTNLKISENGKAFIITEDKRMVGLPIDEKFTNEDSIKKYVLKTESDLNITSISDALTKWNTKGKMVDEAFMFKTSKKEWWCGIKPFDLNSKTRFYIVVIVPESDFLAEVNKTVVIIVAGFLLVLILSLLVIKGYNQKRKAYEILEVKNKEIAAQKKEIEEQRKEIIDSINYSCRIQKAILPPEELVNQLLPQNFVLYKPKDVVSGDFYWMHEEGDNVMFSAADCTGHGVPGAFMSIIGHNGLNRAVREYKLTKPNEILDALNGIIAETLRQNSHTVHVLKDGMDIALCTLNKKELLLEYSGAYNPLYIIRKSDTLTVNNTDLQPVISTDDIHLFEIKATKKPIGNVDSDRNFHNHSISLQKEDLIIIFSDGYADQFGGPRGKKFMYKPLKKLLISLYNDETSSIASKLESRFEEWKGEEEQVDDVIVIGVRV